MLSFILLVLGGVVISMILGSIWYMPGTPMGKIHMRYQGFAHLTKEEWENKMKEMKPRMGKLYLGQAFLSLLVSFSVVFVVVESMHNGLTFGMAIVYPIFNWLCFMIPIIGSGTLWGNPTGKIAWQKFFSDAVLQFLIVLLIAIMAGIFA
jgi:hypothetical protein